MYAKRKKITNKSDNKAKVLMQLSEQEYKQVRPIGAQRPRLYGLPNTHKPEVPLRPILSLVGSAEHKLARFLNNLLEPVTKRFSTYDSLTNDYGFLCICGKNQKNTSWKYVHGIF